MRNSKRLTRLLLAIFVLLLTPVSAYAQETSTVYLPTVANTGQIVNSPDQAGALVPDQYIVVLGDDLVTAASVDAIAAEMAAAYGGELLQIYSDALFGFAVKFPADKSADGVAGLSQDERVDLVEQDTIVTIVESDAINTVQANATWGLDRIDQRNLPLSGTFSYTDTAVGVRAYIIDTGIRVSHTEFGGRATDGYDAVDGSLPAADCHGHGTHVAGTVGGQTYGVAKGVQLIAVRVLNCNGSGTNSGVIAGVNWVTGQKLANLTIPAVANMSLGGGASSALDAAVNNSINAGVTYAIAAGNSNANACNFSPARVGSALTVGATKKSDGRASYSNFGTCLDLFAPGSNIKSAWNTSNTATATLSGTSMATPHVAGVVALFLQRNTTASPSEVATAITGNATPGVVTNRGAGSPNRLLFTNY